MIKDNHRTVHDWKLPGLLWGGMRTPRVTARTAPPPPSGDDDEYDSDNDDDDENNDLRP